tara:strand:+ start:1649 stop:2419 length:771 start_codon:yes stop_codon:yes gene_type:complete
MLLNRLIPIVLLKEESLVKTFKFNKYTYVGDPTNTLRIFNELLVDELIILDIYANKVNYPPNFRLLKEIAEECFMPLTYGGGISNIDHAKKIFDLGFEKISINTNAITNPNLIIDLSSYFGNQAIIGSIDVKNDFFNQQKVVSNGSKKFTKLHPLDWAIQLENLGVGEILLTSVDREGTWSGMDINLIRQISDNISIPLIAHGGAGNLSHIKDAIKKGKASAVGLGSMVTFQKKGNGVLVNFPLRNEIENSLIIES